MKKFKKIISIIMIAALIASVCVMSTVSTGASGTGAGLAEWALKAYNEGWSYVWGGASPGAVDCSGLIYSYCGGNRISMLADAQANGRAWGYVSSGVPRVHGLGLARTGHVGVYIADGMEVDARGSDYGVCYQAIGGWNNWDCWFKLTAVSYPENGWEQFNGDSYYYENGEYIVNTSRTIDGVTYYFDASGRSSAAPDNAGSSSTSVSASSSSTKSSDNGPLKKGSNGSKVEKLQTRLQELGYYNGVVDGDFGDGTETAFKAFQKAAGLYVDGIAGSDTEYLYADDAPYYVAETEKKTEEKVETIEKAQTELAETGAPAEETAEEEEAAAEEPAVLKYTVGDYNDDIAKVQEKLIALGYLEGTADGEFGSMTEAAVKAFQTANNLEATGIVEQGTYDALFSDAAIAAPKTEVEEKSDEDAEKIESNLPVAAASKSAPAVTASVPNTEVEKTTTEISSKGVAAVAESPLFKRGANATNFEFLLWLAIMIVVLLITFAIVYAVERKKQRAAYAGRRYQ